jgi:hypothetical protein
MSRHPSHPTLYVSIVAFLSLVAFAIVLANCTGNSQAEFAVALANNRGAGGSPDCNPPTLSTSLDINGNPLKAAAGATVNPKEIDFSGCS